MWVTAAEALTRAVDALKAGGVPAAAAHLQADLLLEAELRGIPSHGLMRLPRLVTRIRNGVADPVATGGHEWVRPGFLHVDGQQGLGPVVAMEALSAISERARITGVATAAISVGNHLGMLAYYVEKVARDGQIAIAMTTSEALVHPWGGRTALIGSNPIAIAVPASPEPLVMDMATGAVSMGKIIDYANRGVPLEPGWALDGGGQPTTDAAAARTGAITPFGGPKGYALGIAIEVLVGSLTGSGFGAEVRGTLDDTYPSNKGDVFVVLHPPDGSRTQDVTGYLESVRSSPRQRPDAPIRVPGDRARLRRHASRQDGFEIPDEVWAAIHALTTRPAVEGHDDR